MTPGGGADDRAASPQRVSAACLTLADTLADDFEIDAFLRQLADYCLELVDIDGAGVMMADPGGSLRLLASTDAVTQLLEESELELNDGLCVASYHSGTGVSLPRINLTSPRWNGFARSAHTAGYRCADAIPMRHGTQVIGVLNLFRRDSHPMSPQGRQLAQTLADIATVGLVQRRATASHRTSAEQLQQAFTTRLIIEQAKGFLAGELQVSPEEAFHRLRQHARRTNQKLAELAQAVINRTTTLPTDETPPHNRRSANRRSRDR